MPGYDRIALLSAAGITSVPNASPPHVRCIVRGQLRGLRSCRRLALHTQGTLGTWYATAAEARFQPGAHLSNTRTPVRATCTETRRTAAHRCRCVMSVQAWARLLVFAGTCAWPPPPSRSGPSERTPACAPLLSMTSATCCSRCRTRVAPYCKPCQLSTSARRARGSCTSRRRLNTLAYRFCKR